MDDVGSYNRWIFISRLDVDLHGAAAHDFQLTFFGIFLGFNRQKC